ncbi:MAG: tetratricopeptide repeat protein [Actinobacteria bacterium]|nr:tetratricopeptide repeat protein [Actinomycetota bacterium]
MRGEWVLSGVVFRISAGFLVGAFVLLATALSLSEHYLEEERRLAAAGDVGGAIEASRMAVRLDPFDTDALEEQSVLLQQQGRPEEAADALREAIERDPHNYMPYLRLGTLQLYALDDLDAAVESYRAALRLNPKATAASEALAQTLIRKGDLGAAKKEYEKLKAEGTISYQGLYDLGRIYVRTGKPGEGLQAIQDAQRRAEAGLDELEGPLRAQQQELIESMELAIADALVVQGRYAAAREVIAESSSEQAPALLHLLNSDPEAYRESVVMSEIY